MSILQQILSYKKQEIEVRKLFVPGKELYKSILFRKKCLSLKKQLTGPHKTGIIAEFKRKYATGGFMNRDADIEKVTRDFVSNGAAGLSIFTDMHFYGGSSADLIAARENKVPIIRKDFIIDPYDLVVTKAIGADVVLLIASCLSRLKVKRFAALSKELGLEVLLDIHNEKEIGHICSDIDMVVVNNRSYKNFKVEPNNCIRLAQLLPAGMVKIAEAGINSVEDIMVLREAGYRGFIIGEHFMREADPGKAFKDFVGKLPVS